MSASISIEKITKRYDKAHVLDDISLHIEAGEFVVFLGPSGCGKSTLLRMIAGLESVTEGRINIGEHRIDTLPPGERGVAMVFQSYALYPHMTIAQNMSFGLENIKMDKSEIERRVSEAATILEIDHLLNRKPGMLSGGQRQRVAIGRAIVKEPQAFLFDEPLSNLDAALRGRTRLELAQLHQRLGATMIFVTHDQVEAMTLADRIVIMNDKKIEQIGTPMEIYQRPATQFVAKFVGSPAMSILPVSNIQSSEQETVIRILGAYDIVTNLCPPDGFQATGATLGVRAEDTFITDDASLGLPMKVSVVERLGDRTLLYGVLESGEELIAEDSGRSEVKAGQQILVGLNGRAVHLFDHAGLACNERR